MYQALIQSFCGLLNKEAITARGSAKRKVVVLAIQYEKIIW